MKQITKLLREIVPVILGILIALVINNWNEDRKDKKYISKMFSSINKELTETDEEITTTIPFHLSLIDSIDVYLTDNEMSLIEIVDKSQGIKLPTIRINAWKAISNSKIELLEYEKVSALSDIEQRKENLKLKTKSLVDFIYANPEETKRSKKEMMKGLISDILGTEIAIQEDIAKLLDQ